MPKVKVADIDIYRPGGIVEMFKVVQGAQSLLKLLVEQVLADSLSAAIHRFYQGHPHVLMPSCSQLKI